jgi:hypothetical protein
MIRKTVINSILKQKNLDQAFENEALATFIEGEISQKLLDLLSEQDILNLEKLKDEEITTYLATRVPNLNEIISEEVQKAKEKFRIKK